MRKLFVLAALGLGLSMIGSTGIAKADWGYGPAAYGYDDCDYGYGGGYPGGVYVERAYPAPIYVGPVYRRYPVYGRRYDVRFRGGFGRSVYRERYRFRVGY